MNTNLVGVGTEAEVLHGLAGVLGTTEEQGVGTGRGAEGKLIQSQGLTTGLLNAGASGSGETESGNRQLGNVQQAVVIGDGTDHDNGLALLSLANVGNSAGQGNRGAVDSGHEQATEDGLVEVGLGTAYGCIRNQPHEILIKILQDTEKTPLFLHFCAANENRNSRGSHTSQEAVQLHQNLEVYVVALGSLAVGAPHMVAVQVDTCEFRIVSDFESEIETK